MFTLPPSKKNNQHISPRILPEFHKVVVQPEQTFSNVNPEEKGGGAVYTLQKKVLWLRILLHVLYFHSRFNAFSSVSRWIVLVKNETVNVHTSSFQETIYSIKDKLENMDIPLSIGSAISGQTLLFSSRMVKNFRELSLVMKI